MTASTSRFLARRRSKVPSSVAWALLAALLLPSTAGADPDVFAVGNCQNLGPAEHAMLAEIDRATTEPAAAKAAKEIQLRLTAALKDPARAPGPGKLAASVEGWLLKKEWLAALARHEHDADEGAAYCEFLRRQAGIR